MKISELVQKLEELKQEHGDLRVKYADAEFDISRDVLFAFFKKGPLFISDDSVRENEEYVLLTESKHA